MTLELVFDDPLEAILVREADETVLEIPLGPVVRRMRDYVRDQPQRSREIPRSLARVEAEGEGLRVLVYFNSITAGERDGRVEVTSLSADVYVAVKQ